MSNDAQTVECLFKLQAKINMMVLDGALDATALCSRF